MASYTDNEHRFSIRYPEEWLVQKPPSYADWALVVFRSVPGSEDARHLDISIAPQATSQPQDLNTFISDAKAAIIPYDWKERRRFTVHLAGQQGISVESEFVHWPPGQLMMELYLRHPHTQLVLILRYYFQESDLTTQNLYEEMASTIKVF